MNFSIRSSTIHKTMTSLNIKNPNRQLFSEHFHYCEFTYRETHKKAAHYPN